MITKKVLVKSVRVVREVQMLEIVTVAPKLREVVAPTVALEKVGGKAEAEADGDNSSRCMRLSKLL